MIDETLFEAEEKMEKAVEVAKESFAGIRTGRAHPGMFQKITVDYYGAPTPLQQLASFQTPEARTIIISPFDKSSMHAIEKAIQQADLGVNPSNDGNIIRCTMPQLTEERRREYVKMAHSEAEEARVSVRNIRRSAKTSLEKLVKDGVPVGLLGYVDGEPVAWCSIAPFDTHLTKLRKVKDDEDTSRVWSVTCFFVRRDLRGQGLTKQLLSAAVKLAKKHGAKVVEGYGVSRDSPSYRHMGFVPMFEDAGFEEVGREGTRRRVMRMAVGRSRSA